MIEVGEPQRLPGPAAVPRERRRDLPHAVRPEERADHAGRDLQQGGLDGAAAVALRVAEQDRAVLAPRLAAVGADLHPRRPRPVALERRARQDVAVGEPDRLGPHRPQHAGRQPHRVGPRLAGGVGGHVRPAPRPGARADLEVEMDGVVRASEEHGVPRRLIRLLVELARGRPVTAYRLARGPHADVGAPLARAAEPRRDERAVGRLDDGRGVGAGEGRLLPDEAQRGRGRLRAGNRCEGQTGKRQGHPRPHDLTRPFACLPAWPTADRRESRSRPQDGPAARTGRERTRPALQPRSRSAIRRVSP